MTDQTILKHKLKILLEEHKALEDAIEHIRHMPIPDQLAMQRLKRQKLQVKERIVAVRSKIIPDIIA